MHPPRGLPRPTLSVLCATAHPGPLVAELLGGVRDAADEVIIGADARADAFDLGHYADVADVLLRYEYCGPNRHWPWLAAHARGEWLLLLDGDELPSEALVGALNDLVGNRRVRQYSLPIHWVWPRCDRRLTEEPWLSDRQLRLVRNDGGLAFDARKHARVEPSPPVYYLDELPVYHLDLMLSDRATRTAKVARYNRQRFGLLTPEGVPFNEAYYVPEARRRAPSTSPLPDRDADRVRRALAARDKRTRSLEPQLVPLHDETVVTWHAPRRALPPDAYHATVALARPLPTFTAGRRDHQVWLVITNQGTARWPGGGDSEPLVRVGVVWDPVDGGTRDDAGREFLPHAIYPGESALVPVRVSAPPLRGAAELTIDLVHEFRRWFDCGLRAQVEVRPSVSERLTALVERHGPLLPTSEVMRIRRDVGGRDSLFAEPAPDAVPADPHIAALTRDLLVAGWAVDAPTVDRLVEVVRSERPATVLEFGSGTSTIVLAAVLADVVGDGATVISFDEDEAWAARTRAGLLQRGLERFATVVPLSLDERADGTGIGYVLTPAAVDLLRSHPPELIFVDGPSLDSGGSRVSAPSIAAPFVRNDATLLLDDALRDAELCVGEAWERSPEVSVYGIRCTPKGLLEARLRTSPSRPRALWNRLRTAIADSRD